MSVTNPQELKKQLEVSLRLWTANPDFKLKEVTLEQLKADATRYDGMLTDIAEKKETMTPLRNERNALAAHLGEVVVRFRSGVRSYFGGNSSEYEVVGGTRTSARKKSGTKVPVTPIDSKAT